MEHELKILPQYFKAVLEGTKTFELRKNDRDYKVGDTLILKEWQHLFDMEWRYTVKEITKEITYILEGGQYGLGIDYCILGLKPTGIELKNIDLKDITMEEQVAKINEEDEEFAVAIINYDLDNAIEEFY